MQTPKRKRYQKDAAPSDDIITLIQLVRQNPALYNYKLQPNQRRRSDILNGWSEIAAQIGNKYTVEECRRKWKNLRDTYHQYRLRKPKVGDGLSKWRYSKELEFLSNVYQPKLKSHRQKYDENFSVGHSLSEMHVTQDQHVDEDHEHHHHHHTHDDVDDDDGSSMVHHSNITLVSNDAETFILHAYEESVNDDVAMDQSVVTDDTTDMSHIELSHEDNVEDVVEIVKHEHTTSSLDEDGATGAEVDYEEVCLYEESGNAPSVDSETIIGASSGRGVSCGGNSSPNDCKAFQYINTSEFCIEPVTMSTHSNNSGNCVATSINTSSTPKTNIFKNISVLPSPSLTTTTTVTTAATTNMQPNGAVGVALANVPNVSSNNYVQIQQPPQQQTLTTTQKRDELDLFFEFLKNKMQRLSQVDITGIQIEFLNCVLQREAECAQKSAATQ